MTIEETTSPPPAIFITGYFKEHEGYAVYRPHGSGSWLITYTLAGQGLYRQPGVQLQAVPGSLVLLQPDAIHDYSVPADGYWEFLWAHFQPRLSWLSWWQFPERGRGLYCVSLPSSAVRERLRSAFFKLHADASTPSANLSSTLQTSSSPTTTGPGDMLQRELMLNGLEEILLLATRESTQQTRQTLDSRVQSLLQMMAENLKAHYDIETLAAMVALSPSRLSHLFKQETGSSLINVLIALRLDKAARLLEFTNHTIATIAEEVGFSSPFYFSRQFHQRFGQSPSEYRRAIEQHVRQ
ncbi:helix-turn-helix domain-containing protein [Dictyobacter formicarum]|uniref:DNA-binding transcriptional regulator AraC n=1 Tax=Dictyobacter formicarum TaxID=2778368 RepID=A0ABQ3VC06_9CHLR|nr:helix-turn-helix domain-containing protein [Dictyobacter formicarum]GHO82953.1 DNA-binding transcriptional regulator AraC [Dictyobacter formicarum]